REERKRERERRTYRAAVLAGAVAAVAEVGAVGPADALSATAVRLRDALARLCALAPAAPVRALVLLGARGAGRAQVNQLDVEVDLGQFADLRGEITAADRSVGVEIR